MSDHIVDQSRIDAAIRSVVECENELVAIHLSVCAMALLIDNLPQLEESLRIVEAIHPDSPKAEPYRRYLTSRKAQANSAAHEPSAPINTLPTDASMGPGVSPPGPRQEDSR